MSAWKVVSKADTPLSGEKPGLFVTAAAGEMKNFEIFAHMLFLAFLYIL